jgi:hypothetical protein
MVIQWRLAGRIYNADKRKRDSISQASATITNEIMNIPDGADIRGRRELNMVAAPDADKISVNYGQSLTNPTQQVISSSFTNDVVSFVCVFANLFGDL